jgi:hypothetical protein
MLLEALVDVLLDVPLDLLLLLLILRPCIFPSRQYQDGKGASSHVAAFSSKQRRADVDHILSFLGRFLGQELRTRAVVLEEDDEGAVVVVNIMTCRILAARSDQLGRFVGSPVGTDDNDVGNDVIDV